MSDSSLSDAGPNDAVIEQELRQIVGRIYESQSFEELTVKRVRATASKSLQLQDSFFKEGEWKERSKAIIEDEAEKHNGSGQASSPVKSPPKPAKSTARPPKRSSPEETAPKKRRKLAAASQAAKNRKAADSDLDEDIDAPEEEQRHESKPAANQSSSLSDVDDLASEPTEAKSKPAASKKAAADVSESELSELIDEEPKPKRRKKGSSAAKPKSEPKKRGRKSAEKKDLDPDAEEVKRLQGWLVKCGVRKMWARELKPYDTPKEKIRHLKGMLADVGMTGRYSVEKAARIRETRELQADLEAIQEGEKRWGNPEEHEEEDKESEEEEEPQKRRPGRLPNVDLLDIESDSG